MVLLDVGDTKKVMLLDTGKILSIAIPLIWNCNEFGTMLVTLMFIVLISQKVMISWVN